MTRVDDADHALFVVNPGLQQACRVRPGGTMICEPRQTAAIAGCAQGEPAMQFRGEDPGSAER
jgi:hypothetical protein